MYTKVDFSTLKGKEFAEVLVNDDSILFISQFESYLLYHEQDCCENVWIESIDGDIKRLLPDQKILDAYESYSSKEDGAEQPKECYVIDDSYTWSFYVIRTMSYTFTIRFFGTSNGYYSETADLVRL